MLVRHDLDFLVITESWITPDDDDEQWLASQNFNQLKYNIINFPRGTYKRGGGIALVYKSDYKFEVEKDKKSASFEHFLGKLTGGNLTFTVMGVYHPPVTSIQQSDSIFIDQLLDKIKDCASANQGLIVLGDFNIHINDPGNTDAAMLIDAMSALGFTQAVSSATHTSGNTLDLVFTECDSDINKGLQCDVQEFLSDHRWVICSTSLKCQNIKMKRIKKRVLKEQAELMMTENFDDTEVLNCEGHEQGVALLEDQLSKIYDLAAPMRTIKIAERIRVPWFTSDVMTQKRIVRNRQKIWLKYREEHQWSAYKRERTRYRNLLNYNKKCCLTRSINKIRGDTKKLYSFVSQITNSKIPNPLPVCESDQHLANEFGDYFLDKIQKIRDKFQQDSGKFKLKEASCPVFRKFSPIDEATTMHLIKSMKIKSCELDAPPTKHLVSILPKVLPSITRVINLSLSQVIFNNNWKCAIVRPLIKKLSAGCEFKNYRPVSNLSFLSKLLEKAALDQFQDHCDKYDLMPDYQSAYRRGYSCETCTLHLVNNILWAMENGQILVCCMLDLSAAFDTIDHEKILEILRLRFGIVDEALAWYDSYLRPRSFKVNIGEEYSSEKKLVSSVPQGSASGANLFTAFCSPYGDLIPENLILYGFTNDHFMTGVYKAGDPNQENALLTQLKTVMEDTKCWMNDMRLKLNSDKTEIINFGSAPQLKKIHHKELELDGTVIKFSDCARSLGAHHD